MLNLRFDEIVFMDDFFRSSANLLQSHSINRRFLRGALEIPARRLGLRCAEWSTLSEGGRLDVASMMSALSLTASAAGWARTCIADLSPLAAAGLLPSLNRRALVIGWGMTPSILRFLDQAGISFLDVEISPYRFASHLNFHLRTNDRQIEAVIRGYSVDTESIWNEAAAVSAFFARRGAGHLFAKDLRVGLFCGQCAIDLALVCNGRVARPIDVVDAVRSLSREVDLLVIKPHPYEPDSRHLRELAAEIPNATWTHANLYALFCAENLQFACGLSSSALREASYFMKERVQLLEPDRDNHKRLPAGCSDWIAASPDILTTDALARLCARRPEPPLPTRSHVPEDILDRAFGTRWGLDPASPGLPPAPRLQRGKTAAVDAGSAAAGWLGAGWAGPEPEGTWSIGELASLVVPLDPGQTPDARPMRLVIEGHAFEGVGSRRPTVRVRVNGGPPQVAAHAQPGTQQRLVFPLQHGLPRVLNVFFDIAEPTRPCDCGLSEDTRPLGFQLQRLRIEAEPEEIAAPEAPAPSAPQVLPQPESSPPPSSHRLRNSVAVAAAALASLLILGSTAAHGGNGAAAAALGSIIRPGNNAASQPGVHAELMRSQWQPADRQSHLL